MAGPVVADEPVISAPRGNGGDGAQGATGDGDGRPLGFAPFLLLGLQGPSVNELGCLLGLGDGDTHHVVLRNGALVKGIGIERSVR